MNATKLAVKRKISDKLPDESNSTSKKRKVEERHNLNKESAKESDPSVIFNSKDKADTRKIRKKLSSILHYQNKYKYYCKKHNVLYLIENTRKESRELSKKSRDVLVNSFRSLDITKDLEDSQQLLLQVENEYSDGQRNSLNQPTSDPIMTERKVSRIFVTSDDSETNNFVQGHKNVAANNQSANRLTLDQIVHRFILCDESEDSDSDEGYKEEYYGSSKNEDYILTRSPGGNNIIMKKVEDSDNRSEYEDFSCNCTHCNCLSNYHIRNNSSDYDSSFESDSFGGMYNG